VSLLGRVARLFSFTDGRAAPEAKLPDVSPELSALLNLERAMRSERQHDLVSYRGRQWRASPDLILPGSEFTPFMMEDESMPPHKAVSVIPTVYGCVDLLKNALAKLPLRFYLGQNEKRVEVDPEPGNVVWLFQNPSVGGRNESGFEIIEQICASLDLDGNAYLFMDAPATGIVDELTVLPAHLTTPIAGPGNTVARYEVKWAGKTIKIAPEQIIHFRYWSPFVSLKGMSPMGAASLSYKTQRLAQRWNFSILERGGEASGYFTSEQQSTDTTKRDRLELSIRQRYRGPEHAGRPIVLPRGLKRESSMLSHKDLEFIAAYKLTKQDVFEVFSIPPWMKGLKEGGALGDSGAGTDERLFWENAVEPRALRIAKAITTKMLHRISPDLSCEFDLSRVFALQKVRLERAKAIREALGVPYWSVNEAREEDGLPPFPGKEFDLPPKQIAPGAPGGAGAGEDKPAADKSEPKPKDEAKARAAEPASDPDARERARAAARARHDAGLSKWERKFERLWRRILTGQERGILSALEDGQAATVPAGQWSPEELEGLVREARLECVRVLDLDTYLAEDDPDDLALIRSALEALIEARGADALAELGIKLDLDLNAAHAATFVEKHSLRALADVNKTTKIALRESISEGLAKQEGLSEITARIRSVFEDRRANAQTIARTETNPAYQFATSEAWDQSGIVEGKEWVTIQDDATRPEHADADVDGQVRGLDEPFLVAGESLDFPGDPDHGSAWNVINCRCGMLAVLKEDARVSPAARWLARGLKKGPRPAASSNRLKEYFAGNGTNGHH